MFSGILIGGLPYLACVIVMQEEKVLRNWCLAERVLTPSYSFQHCLKGPSLMLCSTSLTGWLQLSLGEASYFSASEASVVWVVWQCSAGSCCLTSLKTPHLSFDAAPPLERNKQAPVPPHDCCGGLSHQTASSSLETLHSLLRVRVKHASILYLVYMWQTGFPLI